MTRTLVVAGRATAEVLLPADSTGVTAVRVAGWGWCAVAASTAGVCGAVIGADGQRSAASSVLPTIGDRIPDNANARRGLDALAARLRGDWGEAVQLDLAGTEFQRRVWNALAAIGPGETITYGGLANRIGRTAASARAVGSAVGANPAPVLVPCHRVLPAGGGIGKYRLGSNLKQLLLAAERSGSDS
jgi:O-6-methylguanine DNA methyltransferase